MTPVAVAYLDAVRDGDLVSAYQWVCGSERKEYPLEDWVFLASLNDGRAIESYRITEAETLWTVRGKSTGYLVRAEFHFVDGQVDTFYLRMSDEKAGWRVCAGPPNYY